MEFKDYYRTLGVSKTATEKEIKQAYRKLARKHHPDVNQGDKAAENTFKGLTEAYEVLGDPEKRKKYDDLGANWRNYEQAGGPGSAPQGGAWNVNYGGGQPGAGRTMTPEEVESLFGDGDPFSDFFQTFFGGAKRGSAGEGDPRGRSGRGRARPGRDVEEEIELGLEDTLNGTTRRLALVHGGESRTVDVRIPQGVSDGSRVRIPGEGERGTSGEKSGDLFLRIRLAPHPTFERRGHDLYRHVAVPLTTAILGGEMDVETLAGKSLRLKVPPATQPGQVFRLKGHGLPRVNPKDTAGDLYATVDVTVPRELTAEQRKHVEALASAGL